MIKKIYRTMELADTRLGKLVDGFLLLLIVVNVAMVICESYGSLRESFKHAISIFETCSIFIFTVEYLLRLISSPYKYADTYRRSAMIRYAFTPLALIDLMVILPYFLPFFIGFDFRILRILRIFRLLRVLKIKRYSKALELITSVFKEKWEALTLSSFILLLVTFLSGSLMYFAEGDVQPTVFPNIIDSVKWVIKTMVFLGYGETVPITSLGRMLGMITVVLGLGWLTLPISILSSGFIESIHKKQAKCPNCGHDL